MLSRLTVVALAAAVSVNNCIGKPRNQRVVENLFAAFNRHDLDVMEKLYSEDAELRSSDFCSPRRGRNEVRRTYKELFDSFPDLRDDVQILVVQDDGVAVKFVSRSTARGPFKVEIATFLTLRNGHIVSDESVFDTAGRPCSK